MYLSSLTASPEFPSRFVAIKIFVDSHHLREQKCVMNPHVYLTLPDAIKEFYSPFLELLRPANTSHQRALPPGPQI